MREIDMRDTAIINSFHFHDIKKEILNVGCGKGRIDFHLSSLGYRVYSTDVKRYGTWKDGENLTFHISDIFDLSSFPISSTPIVICSQVLEQLKDYKKAFANLLKLTKSRLIITVPHKRAFLDPEHCNFWDDHKSRGYDSVSEFVTLSKPYLISISKIITKLDDVKKRQYNYLIMIDRRRNRGR